MEICMRTALSIAGSDPSGGAGIQADIKTFHAHGVFGMSAITAVTVQNTQKVYSVHPINADIVFNQIVCLFEDAEIHGIKIGMVYDAKQIKAVVNALNSVKLPPVVLDPVMLSKNGHQLLKNSAIDTLIKYLFPITDVVTPNIDEAEVLVKKKINSIDDMKDSAYDIMNMGANNVVIKGGHLKSHPGTDIFYDGINLTVLRDQWIDTINTHGTGCTFSSAITANMARGKTLSEAVIDAKTYITKAIKHSISIGKGHGPVNHFYQTT